MSARKLNRGKPALDLIEEATHLLRQAPARLLLAYYIGSAPFVLGLLYFWADMSRGAFAERRCGVAALSLAVLFLWMKCWQTVFASGLRETLSAAPPSPWDFPRVLRMIAVQSIVQPSRLIVLTLAGCLLLPLPWVQAFYENLTVLGDGRDAEIRPLLKRSAGLAALWPGQNNMLNLILALLLVVLWLNAAIAIDVLPGLMKTLLGIETAFTRGGEFSIFNTTFLAASLALAWLAIDPLLKALFALRCFDGESRRDGADLEAALAVCLRQTGRAAAAVLAALLLLAPCAARAEKNNVAKSSAPPVIAAPAFDQAVKSTLAQDKYAWRLPREQAPDTDSPAASWLREFLHDLGETIATWARSVRDDIRNFLDWLRGFLHPAHPEDVSPGDSSSTNWMDALRVFAFVLLAVAASALGVLLWRLSRQGWQRRGAVIAEAIPAALDLRDENVSAAQLPEDEWLRLAREMMAKGEHRLALRAFYLASLSHLGARGVISLARFKSNRDYDLELARRARGQPDLRAAFSENVAAFDRAWYGWHDVTGDVLQRFQGNLERIRAC